MTEAAAQGIHDHDYYKLGRRPKIDAPALKLADVLTGAIPAHPATADHFGSTEFGLYENDKFGDCGPTSVANLVRLVSVGLTGQIVKPSQDDVFALYRSSGNPNFNPDTGEDDNGVIMQKMLSALRKNGIGDGRGNMIRPIAFAKVDATNDDEVRAAISIFGGVLFGVDLEVAQQGQTDADPPKWNYKKSGEWGGHAVLAGAYENGNLDDVISWALRVETTQSFRQHQLDEAWVVVWQWNLDNPAFQEGVDLDALAAAFKSLTGQSLPLPVNPTPVPPTPPAPAPTPTPTPGQGDLVSRADVINAINSLPAQS
jgi:hypothetical protein